MANPPQCQSERRQHQAPQLQAPAIRRQSQALAAASGNWDNARAEAPHESPFLQAIYSWDEFDELQHSCASYTRQLAWSPISYGTIAQLFLQRRLAYPQLWLIPHGTSNLDH
jgi:hypothetical protein